MDVTKSVVQADIDANEKWYSDQLDAIKRKLLVPVREEIKRQNKLARDKYLAQRGRLRKLLAAVENQPIVVSEPEQPDDGA